MGMRTIIMHPTLERATQNWLQFCRNHKSLKKQSAILYRSNLSMVISGTLPTLIWCKIQSVKNIVNGD